MLYSLRVAGIFVPLALLAGCSTQPKSAEPEPIPVLRCVCHPPIRPELPPLPLAVFLDSASVYFDFDSYIVKDDYVPLLDRQVKYLHVSTLADIQVIGNTDERGSSEYNLALGQKRAEAVKKALIARGATAGQIEAISYGKEKPVALDHDEAAWTRNRRVDFVISTVTK
jgi:peptidoglycan-associated lipoprotein